MSEFGQVESMNWFEHQATVVQPSLSDQEEDQIKSWLCIPSDSNEVDAMLVVGGDLSNKQTTVGLNHNSMMMSGPVEAAVMPSSPMVIKRTDDVGSLSEEKGATSSHAAKTKEKINKISKENKRSRSRCQAVELGSSGKKRDIVDTRFISPKKLRPPAVHRVTERKRRDKINEKMKELRELLPRCRKLDKASTLDKAIGYMKDLKMQVQMMSCAYDMSMQIIPQMPQPCMPPLRMLTDTNNPAIQANIPANMNPAGRMWLQGSGMIPLASAPPYHEPYQAPPVNLPFGQNTVASATFPFPRSEHPSTFPFVMQGNFQM